MRTETEASLKETVCIELEDEMVFLNRYAVRRKLGGSIMGSVYLCDDRLTGIEVAVKVLSTDFSSDPEFKSKGFEFIPIITVTGDVYDADTGQWIKDADLSFERVSDSAVFDRYPWPSYGDEWDTDSEGDFPNKTRLLPDTEYNLTVSKPGYTNVVITVTNLPRGSVTNLQIVLGADYGGNNIPDPYELKFGLDTNADENADGDGDGFKLIEEWISNTNPTNGQSYLSFVPGLVTNADGTVTVHWNAQEFRTYRVLSSTGIDSNPVMWATEFGPWTNNGAAHLKDWTDDTPFSTTKVYLIDVRLP